MPAHLSIFVVKHADNVSREVAFTEAMKVDAAIQALGLEPVGGAYAQEGDAVATAIQLVMGDSE